MEYIWSPWRMEYIQNGTKPPGCVFCDAISKPDGPENQVVYRGQNAYVMLNRYPYTSGHLMVVPYAHVNTIIHLPSDTLAEIMQLSARTIEVLNQIYKPEGYNLGMNIGTAAGAGIADHVHFHIVPRWNGDTNFMSSIGHLRVLPEALEDTFQRILEAW